jgi:hypothetical protein
MCGTIELAGALVRVWVIWKGYLVLGVFTYCRRKFIGKDNL